MRRITTLILLMTALVFTFSACGAKAPKIEDYAWRMRTVMHVEGDALICDAAEEETPAHPEAKIIDMTLTAKDGVLTVTDLTNGMTYEGTYKVSGRNPEGTDYSITIDGGSGYATVAMTSYLDGSEEPTLPIALDGYSIYFYAE